MKRFVKKFEMDLFILKRESFVSYSDHIGLPNGLELKMLDYELLQQNKQKYSHMYKTWLRALQSSELVAVALINGNIVSYGQLKTNISYDKFYKIGKDTAYLSSFYTDPDYRGCHIYPAVISYLVESAPEYKVFFISAYTTNHSSINGLTKVGFVPIKRLRFLRILKTTVNRYHLHYGKDSI